MKNFLLLLVLIVTNNCLHAQSQNSLSLSMYNKIHGSQNRSEMMFLLVKGNVDEIREFVIARNGKFINAAGDIASVKISVGTAADLIKLPFVKQVGSDYRRYLPMNDTMRMRSFVNEVNQGEIPLTRSYRGRGVLLGIIDSGIDFAHPDFKDSTGHTRVKWLWDMVLNDSANSPQPYDYGQEFSGTQIDNGLASAHTGEDQYGHGTYVTGIAAGNGTAVGRFQGVAPETDLIVVHYDFGASDSIQRVYHAVEYILDKAQQLGMPCVINASLGDYNGSHDGLDLESQYISNLLNQQGGRAMVAACGDIGVNWPYHIGRNSVAGDTAFTWFNYTNGIGAAYIQVFADTADFNQMQFAIGADKVTPYYHYRGRTPFTTIHPTIGNPVVQPLMASGNQVGLMQFYTAIVNGVYTLEIIVLTDSTNYNWRFITTGNGRYDSWTLDIYHPSWVWQGLPSVATFPDIAHYHAPDTVQTIVSGFNCLDNVISVGNYTNTDRHVDVDSILRISVVDFPQQIATNSGRGPTRDGRIKPDLQAPGNYIISAAVHTLIPGITHNKIATGGYHITGGGTSASAPVVAGIAALFLEQNPTATCMDVKNALTSCAYQDSYMWGPYPNNAWGYGKVDAFEAMTTCSFATGLSDQSISATCRIYPNPANNELTVEHSFGRNVMITIFDLDGRLLISSSANAGKFSVPVSALANGVYVLEITPDDGIPLMKRFIISR